MMPQTSAQRPALTLHHRKSIGRLTDQQLSDVRRAYSTVLPIQDERAYNHHAGIHGLPLPIYCKHGDLLFLPWHRAYYTSSNWRCRTRCRKCRCHGGTGLLGPHTPPVFPKLTPRSGSMGKTTRYTLRPSRR